MKNQKIKISNSKTEKADSLILMLARVIGKLFTGLISFDEKGISRLFADCLPIDCRLFADCLSVTSPCNVLEESFKARLKKSIIIPEYISAAPMGYFKMVPQYMPRAPD